MTNHVIPAEAVEAAAKEIDAPSEPVAQEIARRALKAAMNHILSHFANRISWRCSECEDQIDPEAALRKLQEEAGN